MLCHRVVGSKGALTGYAGGVERKLWLLANESTEVKPVKGNDRFEIQSVIHTRQSKHSF